MELQTLITELKAKNDVMEHEALSTRNKFIEEVQRVEAQRREITSKFQASEYRLAKQIELHGDFDLINKENKALNNINSGLEKQIEMLNKELVDLRAKYEKGLDEIQNLQQGNGDLMILISEANKEKRDLSCIIQQYKQ